MKTNFSHTVRSLTVGAAIAAIVFTDIPTVHTPDIELTASERVTSVTNRTGGRRRLSFIQRMRRNIANRLYRAADKRRNG